MTHVEKEGREGGKERREGNLKPKWHVWTNVFLYDKQYLDKKKTMK